MPECGPLRAGHAEGLVPAYDELREEAPVHCMPGTSTYVLTRYEDVAWVSKRTDLFANGPAPGAALPQDAEALSTRGAEQQRPLITRVVEDLIDRRWATGRPVVRCTLRM